MGSNPLSIQWNLSWKTTPLALQMWSLKTGGLWWQVQVYWNIEPSGRNMWSFKTGGLLAQWSLNRDFTIFVICIVIVKRVSICIGSSFGLSSYTCVHKLHVLPFNQYIHYIFFHCHKVISTVHIGLLYKTLCVPEVSMKHCNIKQIWLCYFNNLTPERYSASAFSL